MQDGAALRDGDGGIEVGGGDDDVAAEDVVAFAAVADGAGLADAVARVGDGGADLAEPRGPAGLFLCGGGAAWLAAEGQDIVGHGWFLSLRARRSVPATCPSPEAGPGSTAHSWLSRCSR